MLRAGFGLSWLYAETNFEDGSPVCGFIPTVNLLYDGVPAVTAFKITASVNTHSCSLNMRAKPFSDAEILARIPNKAEITVLEKDNAWCCIEYKDICGFVMTKYLRFE